MMKIIAPYWKALVAFLAPGAVLIGSAVTEGSAGGETITGSEWITAAVACVITGATVYGVPNQRPSLTEGDARNADDAAVRGAREDLDGTAIPDWGQPGPNPRETWKD